LRRFLPFGGYHMGHCFFNEPLPGAKLTVETAVGHPGRFGQRVNAYAGDATLAHEARGGLEDSFAIPGGLFP
jgi:hypothetical protein